MNLSSCIMLSSNIVCCSPHVSGHPSVPLNLTFTQISIATDSFTVKLNWDPPQNDGGLPIANYFIFINGSQEMGDTSTNVTLMLNSTEEYVISISAVNECGLVGNTTSMIVAGITKCSMCMPHCMSNNFVHTESFDMVHAPSEGSIIIIRGKAWGGGCEKSLSVYGGCFPCTPSPSPR